MSRPAALATVALAVGTLLSGFGCGDDPAPEGTCLFSDLEAGFGARIRARDKGQKTEAPDAIRWAQDIHAAIERANREDKPIFIACHVRQNAGDLDCDV